MIYTKEQWVHDRTFKAEPGQQISAGVYEEMLNVMPPLGLPPETALQALREYNRPIHNGFLMGEPHSCDRSGRPLYLAFGMNDYGKGPKYYFIGLSPELDPLHGLYFSFDCMDAGLDGLRPAEDFASEAGAIRAAADHEATLYRQEYRHGEQISSALLYDPCRIYEAADQLPQEPK